MVGWLRPVRAGTMKAVVRIGRVRLFTAVTLALITGIGIAVFAQLLLSRVIATNQNQAAPIDITKLALTVVGGVGGAVALVVAYRRQRDLEQNRFVERFGAAAAQLGSADVAVRIAGVYAMAGVADESTASNRQQCIDVLCGYLRLPYDTSHGGSGRTKLVTKTKQDDKVDVEETTEYRQNDREVRKTIVRVITERLRKASSGSDWCTNNFDFRTAHLEDADFSYAHFEGTAHFDASRFFGHAGFVAATFSRIANFTEATFSSSANFTGATFSHVTEFTNATFSGAADFTGAAFPGATSFAGTTFSSDTYFTQAAFSSTTDFARAIFSSSTEFIQTTFSGTTDFTGASFSSSTEFTWATFSSDAKFSEARFSGITYFTEATFSGTALFADVTFSSITSFTRATFSSTTGFVGATFASSASFSGAMFAGSADFAGATFSSGADFVRAIFSGNTVFTRVNFSSTADFVEVTFSGGAAFRGVDFGTARVTFENPLKWDPPPQFDWDQDVSAKPGSVLPHAWPPTVVAP